jgi:hypothetical protein
MSRDLFQSDPQTHPHLEWSADAEPILAMSFSFDIERYTQFTSEARA